MNEGQKFTASGIRFPPEPVEVHAEIFPGENEALLTPEDVHKMNITELRHELTRRNESTIGKKIELKRKLMSSIKASTVTEFSNFAIEDATQLSAIKLEEKGSVYSCGIDAWFLRPVKMLKGSEPIKCESSKDTILILTLNGFVYEYRSDSKILKKINSLTGERIVSVSTSGTHSSAVTLFGDVFLWGDNTFGQLGKNGDQGKFISSTKPCLSKYFSKQNIFSVIGSALGKTQSLILTKKQMKAEVFSFGKNLRNSGHVPVKLLFPNFKTKLFKVYAGSVHFGALDEFGCAHTWGDGNSGKLGNGNFSSLTHPTKICRLKLWIKAKQLLRDVDVSDKAFCCIDMALGTQHSLFLYAFPPMYGCGLIFSCGTGVFGQLALGSTVQANIPTLSKDLYLLGRLYSKIETSSTHSIALTSRGELVSWGLNQQGQLGRKTKEKVDFIPGVNRRVGRVGRGIVVDFCCCNGMSIVLTGAYAGIEEEEQKLTQ